MSQLFSASYLSSLMSVLSASCPVDFYFIKQEHSMARSAFVVFWIQPSGWCSAEFTQRTLSTRTLVLL